MPRTVFKIFVPTMADADADGKLLPCETLPHGRSLLTLVVWLFLPTRQVYRIIQSWPATVISKGRPSACAQVCKSREGEERGCDALHGCCHHKHEP